MDLHDDGGVVSLPVGSLRHLTHSMLLPQPFPSQKVTHLQHLRLLIALQSTLSSLGIRIRRRFTRTLYVGSSLWRRRRCIFQLAEGAISYPHDAAFLVHFQLTDHAIPATPPLENIADNLIHLELESTEFPPYATFIPSFP
jgi:hypothetical protein